MLSKPPADHSLKIRPSGQACLSLSRDLAEKKPQQNRWFPHPMTAKVLVCRVNTRVIKDHVRKRSPIQFCGERQLTGNVSA